MKTKNDSVYLEHILDSIKWIESYISDISREHFLANHLVQDAIIRQVEIIGEASKKIPKEVQKTYSDIPWRFMAGMRDKLIHDYFGVDIQVVWITALEDIINLEEGIRKIVHDNESNFKNIIHYYAHLQTNSCD